MEQHAVPQHIASFEFKLFGNLTVRQFVTLAIPVALGALVFFSSLPALIRIPISLTFGALGIFAALVPVQGRPFDKWVVAFIKALSSPTQRIWVKEEKIPEFLSVMTSGPRPNEQVPETITEQGRQRLLDYLGSLPKNSQSPLDNQEQIAIQRLGLPTMTPLSASPAPLQSPIVFPLQTQGQNSSLQGKMAEAMPQVGANRTMASAKISAKDKPFVLPGLEKKMQNNDFPELISIPKIEPKARLASEVNFSMENIIPIRTPDRKLTLIQGIGKTRVRKLHFAPPSFAVPSLTIRGENRLEPSQDLIHAIDQEPAKMATPHQAPTIPPSHHPVAPLRPAPQKPPITATPPPPSSLPSISSQPSQPSYPSIPPRPSDMPKNATNLVSRASIVPLTNKPNVLSGMVSHQEGTPIESAIIIVHDQNGVPVRALKTNKLGQFLSATPLPDGQYTVEVEAHDAHFTPITLNLANKILDPVEIKAAGGNQAIG